MKRSCNGHVSRHADDGAFWRCSVVSPYVANFEEAARPHLRPPSAAERDVSFYFQVCASLLPAPPPAA